MSSASNLLDPFVDLDTVATDEEQCRQAARSEILQMVSTLADGLSVRPEVRAALAEEKVKVMAAEHAALQEEHVQLRLQHENQQHELQEMRRIVQELKTQQQGSQTHSTTVSDETSTQQIPKAELEPSAPLDFIYDGIPTTVVGDAKSSTPSVATAQPPKESALGVVVESAALVVLATASALILRPTFRAFSNWIKKKN